MRIYLLLFFLILTSTGFTQVEVLKFEQEKRLEELVSSLKKKPDPEKFEALAGELEMLTYHSLIPLSPLKHYLIEARKIARSNKELQPREFRIYFVSAILDYHLGDSLSFKQKTDEIRAELITRKDFISLVTLNIAIGNFYGSRSRLDLTRIAHLENEKVLSLFLAQDVLNRKVPDCIANANNLGFLCKKQNELDSAIHYFELGLERAKHYKSDAWIGIISGNIGSCYFEKGDYENARPLLEKDVELSIQKNQHTSAVNALLKLAEMDLKQFKVELAESHLNKAKQTLGAIDPKVIEDASPWYYYQIRQLDGEIAILKGNSAEGVRAMREAMDSLNSLNKNWVSAKEEFLAKRYILEKNLIVINGLEEQQKRNNLYILIGFLVSSGLAFFLWRQRTFNKRLQEKNLEIESQAKQLEKLNLEKNRLFSIVAHDLRSPVANLNSLLEMQDDDDISADEFDKFSKDIRSSLKALNSMLDNILHWAKAGMDGGIKTEMKKASPMPLINQIVEQTKPLLDAKHQSCVVEGSKEIELIYDSNLLSVIIRNLLHNAIKFSEPNSQIQIKVFRMNAKPCIQVIDNGMGMSAEQIKNLFEGKSKMPGTGTSGEKGTGLGLQVSKDFMDAMGAKFEIQSEQGKGTSFILVFPENS